MYIQLDMFAYIKANTFPFPSSGKASCHRCCCYCFQQFRIVSMWVMIFFYRSLLVCQRRRFLCGKRSDNLCLSKESMVSQCRRLHKYTEFVWWRWLGYLSENQCSCNVRILGNLWKFDEWSKPMTPSCIVSQTSDSDMLRKLMLLKPVTKKYA